jgi:hypothetical protein
MSILVELPQEDYSRHAFAQFATAPGFSLGTARAMAWMSQLAYETRWEKKIDDILAWWGLRRIALIIKSTVGSFSIDTRGIIAAGHGATIVAFSGTDPLVPGNWMTDFDIPFTGDDLHKGFSEAIDAVWDDAGPAMTGAGGPLYVTGHSLGAALAIVATDRAFRKLNLRPTATYTYGTPRVGGDAFADRYNPDLGDATFRLVHGDDIVPTVPPARLKFRHVGRMLHCGRGKLFDLNAPLLPRDSNEPDFGPGVVQGVKDRLGELFARNPAPSARHDLIGHLSNLLPPAIADHLPDRYCHAVGGGP